MDKADKTSGNKNDNPSKCVRVAIMLPVKKTFLYKTDDYLINKIQVGSRVTVPFKNRKITGYVLEKGLPHPSDFQLKPIAELVDPTPFFDKDMAIFFEWVANYYMQPIGKIIECALPAGLNITPYKTASITDEGLRAIENLDHESKAYSLLKWIRENPGKRFTFPANDISSLQKKGWVSTNYREPEKTKPLTLKFVRPVKGNNANHLLSQNPTVARAKGEKDFLEYVLTSTSVSLRDLTRSFKNARYLVNKWKDKGIIETYTREVYRDPAGSIITPAPLPAQLHCQQKDALKFLKQLIDKGTYASCLLFGVTGSGKTEVYIRAAEYALSFNRKTIVLVPEIALSIYMESIFRDRMGNRVIIYHSKLSRGERLDQWQRIARGEADVVIGTRSAIFAPMPNLGLIIVDEEHDLSYKQETPPHYNARDMAVVRASIQDAVTVLGSGTPSVQSYHNCINGKFSLISMTDRVTARPLPEIQIIDLKKAKNKTEKEMILTPQLKREIENTLENGNQSILFLNRRGFHRIHLCRFCGKTLKCPNCDVALTHHITDNILRCHYCGFYTTENSRCPSCGRSVFKPYGFGTQKLEQEVKRLFPRARILRIDTDSIRKKNEAFRILKSFSDHKTDILIGTQLIAKGYDFPGVTLVGIVAADMSLGFPDFRAGERTFQIISQVAGRSGRGNQKGKVIVQTFNPKHYAISAAASHNYRLFFEQETGLRKQLGYPPFSHLACIRVEGNSKKQTASMASLLCATITDLLDKWPAPKRDTQVLGPVEFPIARIKGRYRWQILLKSKNTSLQKHLLNEAEKLLRNSFQSNGVNFVIDIDPYHMI